MLYLTEVSELQRKFFVISSKTQVTADFYTSLLKILQPIVQMQTHPLVLLLNVINRAIKSYHHSQIMSGSISTKPIIHNLLKCSLAGISTSPSVYNLCSFCALLGFNWENEKLVWCVLLRLNIANKTSLFWLWIWSAINCYVIQSKSINLSRLLSRYHA